MQELGRLTGVPTPTIDIVLALIRQRATRPRRALNCNADAEVSPDVRSTVESAAPAPARAAPAQRGNVSFRDQAYAALKQAITDADIYAHREEIRLDERQL